MMSTVVPSRRARPALVLLAALAACSAPVVAPATRPALPPGALAPASAPARGAEPTSRAVVPASAPASAAAAAAAATAPVASAPAPLRAYWIGHATVLMAVGDKWIITDPNFSDRVGLFVRRKVTPGIDLKALPAIDWILVSHAHLDHFDRPSLRRLNRSARVAAPPGVARLMRKGRFREIVALDAWHSVEVDGVRVTAVPVRHGDGRYVVDAPFHPHAHTGFVVEYHGRTVFFAGDTAYDPTFFKQIGQRFRIDLALVPIGPIGLWPVRPLMRRVHADPADALRILADVDGRWMIPIHHGTFFTGGQRELDALDVAVRASPVGDRVVRLTPGEAFTLPRPADLPRSGDLPRPAAEPRTGNPPRPGNLPHAGAGPRPAAAAHQ